MKTTNSKPANDTTPTFGLTVLDPVCGISTGIDFVNDEYLALTAVESKGFRTVKGAAAWLARRGYTPMGKRL
jgi:hypothetical protein